MALLSIYTLFAIFLKNWRFEATFPLSIERPTILFAGQRKKPEIIYFINTQTILSKPTIQVIGVKGYLLQRE